MTHHDCDISTSIHYIRKTLSFLWDNVRDADFSFLTVFFAQLLSIKTAAVSLATLISFHGVIDFLNIEQRQAQHLTVLVMSEIFMFLIFAILTIYQYFTSLRVAYYQNEKRRVPLPKARVRKQINGWVAMWKVFGMTMLTFVFAGMAATGTLLGLNWMYYTGVLITTFIWVAGNMLEFISAEDNLTIMNNGKASGIVGLLKRLLGSMEKAAHKRIDKEIGGGGPYPVDPPEYDYNDNIPQDNELH